MQASDDHRAWCGVQERLSCRCIAKELGADINYPRSYACVSAHSSVKLVVCAGRCTCRSRSIGLLWGSGFSGGLWPVLCHEARGIAASIDCGGSSKATSITNQSPSPPLEGAPGGGGAFLWGF